MINDIKHIILLLFGIFLICPFSMVSASGDVGDAPGVGITGTRERIIKMRSVIQPKTLKKKNLQQSTPLYGKPIKRSYKQYGKHVVKRHAGHCSVKKQKHHKYPKTKCDTYLKDTTSIELRPTGRACKDVIIHKSCPSFPPRIVKCETINPADIVDTTCIEFKEKLRKCEAATCQAPYSLDPTVRTLWQIHGKNGGRCIVSNTTEDIGIKDSDGNSVPVTQTCEYDEIGIDSLIERFNDQVGRYYHFSTCDHFEGIHNCSIKSRGKSIKEAMDLPSAEIHAPPVSNS